MSHVGTAIAESLAAHNVSRAFLVPGESFLPVLDGLYDSPVEAIVTRQEGGAAYMAEAHGKATGQPGVAGDSRPRRGQCLRGYSHCVAGRHPARAIRGTHPHRGP